MAMMVEVGYKNFVLGSWVGLELVFGVEGSGFRVQGLELQGLVASDLVGQHFSSHIGGIAYIVLDTSATCGRAQSRKFILGCTQEAQKPHHMALKVKALSLEQSNETLVEDCAHHDNADKVQLHA